MTELALIERRMFLRMHVLDRIFEGNDVHRLRLVNLIENGRQRGRFAAARRAGYENEPCFFLGDFMKDFRQPQ